jgi:replication initiation and membrane attachment protein
LLGETGGKQVMLLSGIRPQTSFRVKVMRPIAESETRVIAHLYLPLVETSAFGLYQFLYCLISPDHWLSGEYSHRYLMQSLGLDLKQIVAARERLEGVGLLSSYRLIGVDGMEYLLHPPLTPYEFFQSDILNLCLLYKMGQNGYRMLRERYHLPHEMKIGAEVEREELTKDFSEVFANLKLTEMAINHESETGQFLQQMDKDHHLVEVMSQWSPKIPEYSLDFEYLLSLFSKDHHEILFSEDHRRIMVRTAFLYGLDAEQIGIMLKDTYYPEKKQWDIGRFEELAKMFLKAQNGKTPVRAIDQEIIEKPLTKEEHLQNLKAISPYQLLRNYQGGGQLSIPDQKLIDYLLNELELKPEVVNVLLDYVLLTYDNKLPRAMTEKIASSWKRKGFVTAEEAFLYAQQEYQKSLAVSDKRTPTTPKTSKSRKKSVPQYIWLQVERDRAEEKDRVKQQLETTVDDGEIEALLQELKGKRGGIKGDV